MKAKCYVYQFCWVVCFYIMVTINITFAVHNEPFDSVFSYNPQKDLTQNNGWKSTQKPIPGNFPKSDTRGVLRFFLFFDSQNPGLNEEIVTGSSETLQNYKANLPLIIIVHGYQQNYTNKHPQLLKDAYLHVGQPANIILVDWHEIAQPNYGITLGLALGFPRATKYVDTFAKQISDLIVFLTNQGVLADPSKVHLIGFSLGGQIAGVTGYKVQQATGGHKIGRITGLDPAGVQYHLQPDKRKKLDNSDAEFVDVIHTSGGAYGYITSIGHVDFYPNGGGPAQPNCKTPLDFKRDLPGLPGSCSHARAWDYFTQSVYNAVIIACKDTTYLDFKSKDSCDDPVNFGQSVPLSARGDYFLNADAND